MPVTACLEVGALSRLFPAESAVVSHGCLAVLLAASLGGDKNDTECGACTVYCSRRGILDHGYGGYVIGVDLVNLTDGSVDKHQRRGVVDRCASSNVQSGGRTGFSRTCGHIETGYGSLKH